MTSRAKRGCFTAGGVVIWVSLLAMVMSSVIGSEKLKATSHSSGIHHASKAHG
jgi:hypothetical protein